MIFSYNEYLQGVEDEGPASIRETAAKSDKTKNSRPVIIGHKKPASMTVTPLDMRKKQKQYHSPQTHITIEKQGNPKTTGEEEEEHESDDLDDALQLRNELLDQLSKVTEKIQRMKSNNQKVIGSNDEMRRIARITLKKSQEMVKAGNEAMKKAQEMIKLAKDSTQLIQNVQVNADDISTAMSSISDKLNK